MSNQNDPLDVVFLTPDESLEKHIAAMPEYLRDALAIAIDKRIAAAVAAEREALNAIVYRAIMDNELATYNERDTIAKEVAAAIRARGNEATRREANGANLPALVRDLNLAHDEIESDPDRAQEMLNNIIHELSIKIVNSAVW